MWKDPIVEEVREARAKLAEGCGYDLHAIAGMLKQHQKETNWPTASAEYVKNIKRLRKEKELVHL